jgi:hypothetical protein
MGFQAGAGVVRAGVRGWMTVLAMGALFAGCALTKPCTDGGDASWPTDFKGDKTCQKKKDKEGKEMNHGRYTAKYPSGRVALIGSFFDGKKHGTWSQYDEKGEKTLERYFDHGVEKISNHGIEPVPAIPVAAPAPAPSPAATAEPGKK